MSDINFDRIKSHKLNRPCDSGGEGDSSGTEPNGIQAMASTFGPMLNKSVVVVNNKRKVSVDVEKFNRNHLKKATTVVKNPLPTAAIISAERSIVKDNP